jgi:hypothetical protein
MAALEDLLPEDHRARLVWEMVESYDLRRFTPGLLRSKVKRAVQRLIRDCWWQYGCMRRWKA